MNISKLVYNMHIYDYNMYIYSIIPFLGDNVKYIKPMHVFGYDDKQLLELISSLMEDKYLGMDSDFEDFGFPSQILSSDISYGPREIIRR